MKGLITDLMTPFVSSVPTPHQRRVMSNFEEKHAELLSIIRLSKLSRELHEKLLDEMRAAQDNPTTEALDEVLLLLGEYQLVRSELLEKVGAQ